jgi:hypothetical protein
MAFENKLIVITGGAGGIARETGKSLLAQGAELLLIGDKCSGRNACLPFRPIGPAKRRQLWLLRSPPLVQSCFSGRRSRASASIQVTAGLTVKGSSIIHELRKG